MTPELLEVVQSIADLENVETNIKSITATINGVSYSVDPTSVTASSSSTCDTGYYTENAACGKYIHNNLYITLMLESKANSLLAKQLCYIQTKGAVMV